MDHLIQLLKSCSHSNFILTHNNIMIFFSIYPSNFLQSKTCFDKLINSLEFWLSLKNLECIECSSLSWLVDGLHNTSNTILIVRIFSIISIQEPNSLFSHVLLLNPKLDKLRHLINIHEFNIINMSVFLSFDKNWWRNTFVAHCLRVWLMILATLIHLITNLWRGQAVSTLHISRMHSLTL